MNYAFRYLKESNYMKDIDEIIIRYSDDSKVAALLDFVQKHDKQRVIADLEFGDLSDKHISGFKAATAASDSFTVRLSSREKETTSKLKNAGIKFFFKEYCSTWDLLKYHLSLGVSDVYIVSEMLFSLDKVKAICGDVKLRAFPNVCQSTALPDFEEIDSFTTAWISPYDIPAYEKYIDVLELYGPINKQDSLYNIYKDQKWSDDLSILIFGFKDKINANMLPPHFAERRISCGKRCNYSACNFCQRAKDVALTMHENGYEFKLKNLH